MHLRFPKSIAVFAAATLVACGGGGGSGGSGSPIPLRGGGKVTLSLSPSTVSINAVGAQQLVTVSASGYSGSLTIDAHQCANIASSDASSVSGPQGSFTITAIAAGQCTVNVVAGGSTQSLPVTVTTTTGNVS